MLAKTGAGWYNLSIEAIILLLVFSLGAPMKPLSRTEITTILKAHREELRESYGVTEIGLFGSCLRNENHAGSDVDLLVDFVTPPGFFKFLELEEKLSSWLGARVDLVTRKALKPRIGKRILQEMVLL
jgi:predicted nucleotidyltransferase